MPPPPPEVVGTFFFGSSATIAFVLIRRPATNAAFWIVVARLDQLPLSHVQILRASDDLSGTPVAALQDTVGYYRSRFRGTIMANLGYDKASASSLIERGGADLVSFAKSFISNPDLVRCFERDLPLNPPVGETFYQGGGKASSTTPQPRDAASQSTSQNPLRSRGLANFTPQKRRRLCLIFTPTQRRTALRFRSASKSLGSSTTSTGSSWAAIR